MKAIVEATGEIVEVKSRVITSPVTGRSLLRYVNQKTGVSYFEEELFFPKDLADDPDYWTRLEHTYAGMAMQGLMSYVEQITPKEGRSYCDEIVDISFKVAYSLVQKLKEKEEK